MVQESWCVTGVPPVAETEPLGRLEDSGTRGEGAARRRADQRAEMREAFSSGVGEVPRVVGTNEGVLASFGRLGDRDPRDIAQKRGERAGPGPRVGRRAVSGLEARPSHVELILPLADGGEDERRVHAAGGMVEPLVVALAREDRGPGPTAIGGVGMGGLVSRRRADGGGPAGVIGIAQAEATSEC